MSEVSLSSVDTGAVLAYALLVVIANSCQEHVRKPVMQQQGQHLPTCQQNRCSKTCAAAILSLSVLFTAKTLLAWILSTQQDSMSRMHLALGNGQTLHTGAQEYFLHALSQPRPHASLDLMQEPCRDDADGGMRSSPSYHGLDPLGIPSAAYGAMHNIHASFIQAAHARQAYSRH